MTGMWTKGSNHKGFTLLEIIISLGLITTALLAVFRLQAQNLDLQSEAQFVTLGKYLAQERISRIEASDSLREGTTTGEFGADFPYFSYEEEVSQVPDMDGLFKVRVKVRLEQQDHTKDLLVETYLFRTRT